MAPENKPTGTAVGLGLIALGLLGTGYLYYVVTSDVESYYPKLMVAGPTLLLAGIAMMLLPGTAEKEPRIWWRTTPLLHRVLWILAGIVGLAIGFYFDLTLRGDM